MSFFLLQEEVYDLLNLPLMRFFLTDGGGIFWGAPERWFKHIPTLSGDFFVTHKMTSRFLVVYHGF